MTQNKKFGISIVIIVFLAAYLVLSGRQCDSVPKIKPWKGEPDYALMQHGSDVLYFKKKDGFWLINKEEFPADENKIGDFLNKINNLSIEDLVSEQPYYERYGLTAESETVVIVKQGDTVLRQIHAGNIAPSGRHTFIKLADSPEVFRMEGIISYDSDMQISNYRDMRLCNIKADDITDINIAYGGKTFELHKILGEDGKAAWESPQAANRKFDFAKTNGFVIAAAGMLAAGFAEENLIKRTNKKAAVTIKGAGGEIALDIFPYAEEGRYAVLSSASKFPFIADDWTLKKFFIDDLSDYFADEQTQEKQTQEDRE